MHDKSNQLKTTKILFSPQHSTQQPVCFKTSFVILACKCYMRSQRAQSGIEQEVFQWFGYFFSLHEANDNNFGKEKENFQINWKINVGFLKQKNMSPALLTPPE